MPIRLRFATHCATLLAAAVVVSAAQAAAPTLEERLAALEAGYAELKAENTQLRALVAAGTTPVAPTPAITAEPAAQVMVAARANTTAPANNDAPAQVLAAGNVARLTLGGFVQAQYEAGDAGDARFVGVNDRFYIRRGRISVTGAFAEHFDFRVEADFGANSLSPSSGLRAAANEIYVNWNKYPAANLRIGYLKPAFGAEQLASDLTTPTIERFLGSDRIADGRQPGLGLYGSFLEKRLGYTVTFGNGNGNNSSLNDNDSFMSAVRLYGTLFDSPRAGRLTGGINAMRSDDTLLSKPGFGFNLSGGTVPDAIFRGERSGWGIDAAWSLGRATLSGELLRQSFKPDNAVPAADFDAQGWHLTATYMLLPQRLEATLRREVFDPDLDVAGDATENWVAGLNYLIKGSDIKLMVNYMFGDAPNLPDDSGRLFARMQIAY
jgi:phosphate-selective porin